MTAQPKPTLGTMDPFDSDTDSWPAYSERLEQFFVANDIADGKKVAVLLTVIGTKAYTLLRNIIAPDKPASIWRVSGGIMSPSGSKTNRHSKTFQVPPKKPVGG